MATDWYLYQEEAANFFRTLGLSADTNVSVKGARTTHNVDVLVRSQHAGFVVTWIVECKHWKSRVSKLHVLALREIVADAGADRGIILSESGYQSGAIEAASLTNVQVTSLADVRANTRNEIVAIRLRECHNRTEVCRERYWNIPKELRIKHGLRTEYGPGFSGFHALNTADDLLRSAFRGSFPVEVNALHRIALPAIPTQLDTPEQLADILEPLIREFEARLDAYDVAQGTSS